MVRNKPSSCIAKQVFSPVHWKQLQQKSANSSAQSPKPGCAPKLRVNKRYSQLGRLLITWWKHFLIMQQAALNNLLEKTRTLLASWRDTFLKRQRSTERQQSQAAPAKSCGLPRAAVLRGTVCWKAKNLGHTGMVAGHRDTCMLAEGKVKCGRQAGCWLSRQEEAVTSKGEAKNGYKRNWEGESSHKEMVLNRQRDSTLTVRWWLCHGHCPDALAGLASSANPAPSWHRQAATSLCNWKAQRWRHQDTRADGGPRTQWSCGDPPAPGRWWSSGNWRHRLRMSDECAWCAAPVKALLPIWHRLAAITFEMDGSTCNILEK